MKIHLAWSTLCSKDNTSSVLKKNRARENKWSNFLGYLVTFLNLLDLSYQKTIRTDGPFYHPLLLYRWDSLRDGDQPVLALVVFLSVLGVDSILQNRLVPLARLVGSECSGILGRLRNVWGWVNPSAIHLMWAWLLNSRMRIDQLWTNYFEHLISY